jgi:predicted GTPase
MSIVDELHSRVDELNEHLHDTVDVVDNVLVQTVDLARAQYFLRYASLAKVNVLLSGTTGTSKSSLLDSFVAGLGQSSFETLNN